MNGQGYEGDLLELARRCVVFAGLSELLVLLLFFLPVNLVEKPFLGVILSVLNALVLR